MASFSPSKKQASDFNNGVEYVNGKNTVNANDINNLVEAVLYAQEVNNQQNSQGLPIGGNIGDILVKQGAENYKVAWSDILTKLNAIVNQNSETLLSLSKLVETDEEGNTYVYSANRLCRMMLKGDGSDDFWHIQFRKDETSQWKTVIFYEVSSGYLYVYGSDSNGNTWNRFSVDDESLRYYSDYDGEGTLIFETNDGGAFHRGEKLLSKEDIENTKFSKIDSEAIYQNGTNIEDIYAKKTSLTNLMPIPTTNQTKNGVTFTANSDRTVTLNGTASADAVYKIYENAKVLPTGIQAGKKYIILHNSTVGLRTSVLYSNDGSTFLNMNVSSLTNQTEMEIPSDAVGLQIKFYALATKIYNNEVVKYELYDYDAYNSSNGGIDSAWITKTDDRIEALENFVDGKSIMPISTTVVTNKNGVDFTPSNGGYIINGTPTADAVYKIYENNTSLPSGFETEKEYYITYNSDVEVGIGIGYYDNSSTYVGLVGGVENSRVFTIPKEAKGLQIKFYAKYPWVYDNVFVVLKAYPTTSSKYLMTLISDTSIPKPMLTIIDDDGVKKFKTLLLPIIQSKKVPIASAVVTARANGEIAEYVDGSMDWEDVKECYLGGAEILSHSHTHITEAKAETMTREEIQYDYQTSQNMLRSQGIKSETLVYSGNSPRIAKCVDACKMVFSYAISNGEDETNYKGETDRYVIKRYTIEPYATINELQAMIDDLVDNGTGWIVLMVHTSSGDFQQSSADVLSSLIDYAIANDVRIVTTECGIRHYIKK